MLAPPDWTPWGAVAVAAALVVAAVDAALGSRVVLIGLVAFAPPAAALRGGRGDAAVTGVLALVLALVSGLWNDDFGRAAHVVALVLAGAGALVGVLLAQLRSTSLVTARRFALLRDLVEVGDGAGSTEAAVERVFDLLVPALADMSGLDLMVDGEPQRLGARVAGPQRALGERAMMRRVAPQRELAMGSAHALREGRPHLVSPVPDELLQSIAATGGDLQVLRDMRLRAMLFLPLSARGSRLGSITLGVGPSGRRYHASDLAFARVAAGRVALALDNTGLSRQAEQAQRQMGAALDALEEAVTMNAPDGRTIYANAAAVRLLHAPSASELTGRRPGEISERFGLYDERGRPIARERLPAFRALAGEVDPPPLLVRNVVRETGEERWLLNKVSVLRDERGRITRVVNVIEDLTQVKRAELSQRLLAEASRALGASLDFEVTLQRVARAAVGELADWCGVDLPGEGGRVDPVAIAHADPARVRIGRELRSSYPVRLDDGSELARVILEGRTWAGPPVDDALLQASARDPRHLELLRGVGFGVILVVPLMAAGRPLGALTLVRSDAARRFSSADVELAEELGRRAGTAVFNARLFTERAEIARDLQQGLLPPRLPDVPGWHAATLYRPAGDLNEVGGDFYDAFPTPGGWMVVVGDVAGQGAKAAALTALARFTVRTAGQLTGDLLDTAAQLNRTLRDQPELALVTAALVLLAPDGGAPALTAVSCGHPLPVVVRGGGGAEQVGEPGPLGGAFDDAAWIPVTIPMGRGDGVVLYTDGVLDTVGDGGRFGEQRLLAALRRAPADAEGRVRAVDDALRAFQRGRQRDDTAVVALSLVDPHAAARPPRAPARRSA